MITSIRYRKTMRLLLLSIVLYFQLLPAIAQISGDLVVCQDDVRDYTYTTQANCYVTWTVSEGVFAENNGTSINKYASATGAVSIQVKWTGQGIGSLHLSACNSAPSLTVTVDAIPFSVIATPSTINLGGGTTLTAVPSVPINPTYNWTTTSYGHLLQATGSSVGAVPIATSEYTCVASYTFTSGVTEQTCTKTKKATVTVIVPPITGNTICCSQCIVPSQTPTPLEQAPGTTVSGGNGTPFKYQWLRSTDGILFADISGQTGVTFSPGPLHQTTWYARTVSATGIPEVWSNIVRIDAPPATRTVSAATYAQNATLSARETMTILGDQEPATDVQVEFRAGEQILVSPSTILYPGIILYAGFSCNAAARIGSVGMEDILEPTPTDRETALSIYPNPSPGETTVHYTVAKYGYARVTVTDSRGVPVLTPVDAKEVAPGEYDVTFSTRGLNSGLYFCIVQTANSREVKRISVRSN